MARRCGLWQGLPAQSAQANRVEVKALAIFSTTDKKPAQPVATACQGCTFP